MVEVTGRQPTSQRASCRSGQSLSDVDPGKRKAQLINVHSAQIEVVRLQLSHCSFCKSVTLLMTRHVRAVWTRLQCNSLSYIQRLNNESFTEPTSYRLTPIEPPQAMANVLGLSRCWITNIWTKNSVSVSLLTVRFKHIESTSVACNDLISNLRCENGAGDDLRTDLYKRESTRFPFSGKKLNHHQMCSMCSVSFALYDDCSLARNQSPLRHDFFFFSTNWLQMETRKLL